MGVKQEGNAKKGAAGMIQAEIKGKTCVLTPSCIVEGCVLGAFYGQKDVWEGFISV